MRFGEGPPDSDCYGCIHTNKDSLVFFSVNWAGGQVETPLQVV